MLLYRICFSVWIFEVAVLAERLCGPIMHTMITMVTMAKARDNLHKLLPTQSGMIVAFGDVDVSLWLRQKITRKWTTPANFHRIVNYDRNNIVTSGSSIVSMVSLEWILLKN